MKISTTGFFWYKENQYCDFKKLLNDGDKLPDTYAEWIKLAEDGFNSLLAKGHRVIKIEADIGEFKTWCARNGYDVDSKGRLAFVNFKVAVSLGLVKD